MAYDLDVRGDPRDQDERVPSSVEAEQGLLGILLFDNDAIEAVADALLPGHFYEPFHGRLYAEILARINAGQRVDATTLAPRFDGDAALAELGGVGYLADLIDRAPPTAQAEAYTRTISDLALKRELIKAGAAISVAGRKPDVTGQDALEQAERSLTSIAHGTAFSAAWVSAGTVVSDAIELARTSKGLPGLSTGLGELDEATGGFRRGVMTIIAGRPAMGKSSSGLQIAKAAAQSGKGALFFSMEMPPFDLGLRMACDLVCDPYAPWRDGKPDNPTYFEAARGKLPPDHWGRLVDAGREIAGWPVAFDTRPGLTVAQMLSAARRKLREWERAGIEPGVIVVDHLTIARPEQDRRGNKVAEVGDISRGLAEMAKTLDLPVVALCQLSRDVEKRQGGDRRPNLADLRWSGEIEQDARLVAFLYRPEYYVRKPEDPLDQDAQVAWREKLQKVRHRLYWLIEKNNNGPTGEVLTYCDIACSAIRDQPASWERA